MIFLSSVQGQNEIAFTLSFENVPLEEVITKLEDQEDLKFYFIQDWIDTVKVSATYIDEPLSSLLSDLLKNTRLNFFIKGAQVILTNNSPIKATLPTNFLITETTSIRTQQEVGYVFQREYEARSNISTSKVLEIGRKSNFSTGQSSTIAGAVKNKQSGEAIVGALVYIEDPFIAASTDASGFYALTIPNGKHTVRAQFTGMENLIQEVVLFSDGSMNLDMDIGVIPLEEVVIESDRDANISQVEMGLNRIDMKTVNAAPKVLGETDIIKIATTLPGVQTIGEGASGFYVRGGGADQNLILLDGAPIYNSSHFLGFFSAFNSDALKSSNLYKSSLPAKYGGRLSSILEIETKDGNKEKFSGEGGISPVTTRLTLETPILKGKGSVLLGGRSTYSRWVLDQVPDETIKNSDANFQDAILKVTASVSNKDNLSMTGYFSRDEFKLTNDSLFSYQNRNIALNWAHTFSPNLNALLTAYQSNYLYDIGFNGLAENAFDFGFDIKESGGKLGFNYFIRENQSLEFGLESKLFELNPGSIEPTGEESIVTTKKIDKEKGLESALYLSQSWDLSEKISLSTGLRYSLFNSLGPQEVFRYANEVSRNESSIIDTTTFSAGENVATYHGPEVRVSGRYSLNGTSSVKMSYGNTRQYIHLLSNTNAISPTDTWKLSDTYIKPQRAQQISIGYYKNVPAHGLELSAEAYYKSFNDLLDYKIGSELILNEALETDVIQGKGRSYGLELFLKKRTGKLNGWMSYTYSRSFLKLDGEFSNEIINNGDYFPTNFDKPHNLNIIANYTLTRRFSFSANFNYSQGRPITFPVGQYELRGVNVIQYSDRNQFRIPDYIRLDLAINIEGSHKIKKLAHSSWTVSVYNVFGRDNVYSVFFQSEEDRLQGYTLSVFGNPIPSITYNFRF